MCTTGAASFSGGCFRDRRHLRPHEHRVGEGTLMSIRAIKVHGRKVWQARIALHGQRMSTIRPSKAEAKAAEAELLGKLQARVGQLEQGGGVPATVRALLEGYVERLAARGKSAGTVGRATSTALAV